MKIFVNADIFYDLLTGNKNSQDAVRLCNLCKSGFFQGYVTESTLIQLAYVAKKENLNINNFLQEINGFFQIIKIDNSIMRKAISLNWDMLDKALISVCAKEENCECIVSNKKYFNESELEVISNELFLKKYT